MDYVERLRIHDKQFSMRKIRYILKKVEYLLTGLIVDLTITDSPSAAEALISKGAKSCISILNVPSCSFKPNNVRKKKENDRIMVGRIGAFSRQLGQGAEDLIELLANSQNCNGEYEMHILMVGNFVPANYKQEVLSQLRPFRDRVSVIDYVSHNEVPNWYSKLDICVIRYDIDEGSGYTRNSSVQKLFEAMAIGIPIVISASKYLEGLVCEWGCGVVAKDCSSAAITEAVYSLLEDRALMEECGCNGKKAFTNAFNWEIEEQKLRSSYPIFPNGIRKSSRKRKKI
jgi:glycosyltransferase involved in cell wall biosynthesis